VLAREMAWVDHQNALKSTIDELEKLKLGMEEDVAARKGELASLKQEWDSALAALRDEKDFLSSQKTEINQLVKGDIAALKEKEQELLGMINDFNKDQSRLDREERAILARIRLLEKDQKVLNSTKESLVEREQKLVAQEKTAKKILAAAEKAKSLASELPKMRREASVLKKQVAKLERAAIKYGASRAAVHAARVTRTLQRMRTPEVGLEPAAVETAAEAPALEAAPELEARSAAPAVRAARAGRHKERAAATGHDELHSMIENARSAVQSGNVQSALAILDDLESAARRLSEEDRRQLSYEIKDLRTSIKLAML
jgi:chromosome segregation ATPase